MKTEQLSKAYARAIYEAAFEKWVIVLKQVREGLKSDPNLAYELTDRQKSDDDKRALLRSVVPGEPVEEVENVVLLLARDGHLGMLEEVIAEFENMVTLEQLLQVTVTTAIPLTEDEQSAMMDKLKSVYGNRLKFGFTVDPDILGGVVVRVGGKVIDDSVAARLSALREKLGIRSARASEA